MRAKTYSLASVSIVHTRFARYEFLWKRVINRDDWKWRRLLFSIHAETRLYKLTFRRYISRDRWPNRHLSVYTSSHFLLRRGADSRLSEIMIKIHIKNVHRESLLKPNSIVRKARRRHASVSGVYLWRKLLFLMRFDSSSQFSSHHHLAYFQMRVRNKTKTCVVRS